MPRVYEVQITSLCPPQGFLRLEVSEGDDAVEMADDFFRTASPEDIENALRVSHMPIEDAIGCGRYEIGKIRRVEVSCDK